ncbi:uncharacterized protein LOC119094942 [Pollicipes pollicipes]|uniref:uncharacterized protein LOC119094942 n=1 Tax=Pollicipes pollicipes TaxID=41117 RepID=UPI001884C29B|nr:uncharacterized protein LOC119094942 [Pollicipes pollicipes]
MPGTTAEYARLPVTETAELTSDEEDDLYTRPPRRQRGRAGRPAKPSLQATPSAFREAATRPVKRYQLLDEEDALGALQAGTPDVRVRSALSVSKKACLALTCLLVLTACSVAVWFVPCRWYGCRSSVLPLQQSSVHRDYETMFPGIVVTTRLEVAPAVYVDSADLVFGYRTQDSEAGGVMVVESSGAAKLWRQELYEAPTDLQCGGVDLNGNGIFECLATGPSRMMALINMDRREVEWYLHAHNSSEQPLSLLAPLLLTDLTSDVS